MRTTESFVGRRVLEVMRSAPLYSSTIFDIMQSAVQPDARKVLDFGAGDGLFLQKLRDRGLTADAVEPDLVLQALLRSAGVMVYSDIGEVPIATYDFAYSINVLEHLLNLDEACAELFRVIKPHGRLFVFVPAFEMLWTKLDDEVGHIRRFTRKSLVHALQHANFVVDEVRYFDSLGFPTALGIRLLEKANLFRYEAMTVGLYDRILFPISHKLDRLFKTIVGKNIIAIAHKPIRL